MYASERGDALSRIEYERLLDAATTYRQALVVRLVAEAGLRTSEIVRISPDALRSVGTGAILDVSEGDSTRVTYLNSDLARAFERYVRSNDLDPEVPIVDVTPRRLSMLIDEVTDEAADQTGNDRFRSVSTADLRQFFAETLLVEEDVDPRIVRTVGGWQSLDTLVQYLDPIDEDAIVEALSSASVQARSGEPSGSSDSFDELSRVLCDASAVRAIVRLDADGYVERWHDARAADVRERGDLSGRHLSSFYDQGTADDRERDVYLSAARETGTHETDGWWFGADGERFHGRTVVSARRHDDGTAGFTMLVFDSPGSELTPASGPSKVWIDVTERVRTVGDSLLSLSDRAEIEHAVCEGLTEGSAYSFAWIGATDLSEQRFTPSVSAEIDDASLEAMIDRIDEADSETPWQEAVRTESVCTGSRLDTEQSVESIIAVPLQHRQTTYGVLVLATERHPERWERDALSSFGRRVGHTITAAQRRKLLLSDSIVELEFWCADGRSFFVTASDELDCRFALESIVPVSESALLFFVTLSGGDPAPVFDRAAEHRGVDEFRLVESHEDGALLEFVVSGDSPLLTLTAYGGTITDATFESGEGTLLAEIARDADPRTFVEGLETAFPRIELVGKTEIERPVRTVREFREGVDDRLTDRQESCLQAAYYGGYFDWPRGSTAEEVADSMGVSSPTLHNHLRKGQHVLMQAFFEGSEPE
ncbi:bacterio-opsin activator domain-containing protein [Natranaeroarchaeum aerophilus]|uniref:Helix-turn-helix domain-containing protein n=1 Tax=Natranaeroarchaeum aerophilus TaxID=2917711 RepID=A0AAE3FQV5_9EURY|nr:bacterio-opsin activator domain-containing protein [Natranaeroarchaeum aerophilus]MCL9813982.1 helix-turn-helix domain-containing protein [Natranaeroarchaeum aerophilus]